MLRICRVCGAEFTDYPRKKGYINECEACTEARGGDVPLTVASPDGDRWEPIPETKMPKRYSLGIWEKDL